VLSKKICNANHAFSTRGLVLLLLLYLVFLSQTAICETDSGEALQLSEQESWVLTQIRQGKEADLKKNFAGKQENYPLTNAFLEKLLLEGFQDVQISHRGVKIANAIIAGDLSLENGEINHAVYLTNCIFQGQINLQKSHFKKDLSFQGSHFLHKANFTGIKIDGSIICTDAIFEDECLWCDAKVDEQFQAERAKFRSTEATADFNSIKIGDCAFFNSAEFHGPVIFVVATIGKQFLADEAKFLHPEKLVNFGGIKLGRTIFFRGAEFRGPVMFEFAEIGVNFRAARAKILNERLPNNFSKMKVGQLFDMDGTFIRGDLDLSFGDFYDVKINGEYKDETKGNQKIADIHQLKIIGTLVQRNLSIANVDIYELLASQMQVKGQTNIHKAQINKLVDFRNANLQALNLLDIKWPEVDQEQSREGRRLPYKYNVLLGGLTYSSISIDKPDSELDSQPNDYDYNDKDFNNGLNFVDACPFNTQNYIQLETFFKRIGRDSWANSVFMRMHNRELAEKMEWYDPRRWLEWFFWGKIAGYGRAPFRVFFLSLAFIILGAYLFDPIFLKDNKMSLGKKRYQSFFVRLFISLDRFLPLDMGLAKDWDAHGRRFSVWLYYFLHKVLGWILIPIALASIYSQLK
jgi:hypothetical protein